MKQRRKIIGLLAIIGIFIVANVYAQTIPSLEQLQETLTPFINQNIQDEDLAATLVEFLSIDEVDDAPQPAQANAEVKDVEPPEETDPTDSTDDPPAQFNIPAGTLENLGTLLFLNSGQVHVNEPDYDLFQVFFTRIDWDYVLEYADVGGSLDIQVFPDRDGDTLDSNATEDQFVRAGRVRGLRDARYVAGGNTSTVHSLDGTSARLNADFPGSNVCNEIARVSYITELEEVTTAEDLPDKIYPNITAFHESGSILYIVPSAYDLPDDFEFETEDLRNPLTLVIPPGTRAIPGVINDLEDEVVITVAPGARVQVYFVGDDCSVAIDVQEGSAQVNTIQTVSTVLGGECLVIRPNGTVSVAAECEDALDRGFVGVPPAAPPVSEAPPPTPTILPPCNLCIDLNGNIRDQDTGGVVEFSGGRALNITPACEIIEYAGGPRKFCPGVNEDNIFCEISGVGCVDR